MKIKIIYMRNCFKFWLLDVNKIWCYLIFFNFCKLEIYILINIIILNRVCYKFYQLFQNIDCLNIYIQFYIVKSFKFNINKVDLILNVQYIVILCVCKYKCICVCVFYYGLFLYEVVYKYLLYIEVVFYLDFKNISKVVQN